MGVYQIMQRWMNKAGNREGRAAIWRVLLLGICVGMSSGAKASSAPGGGDALPQVHAIKQQRLAYETDILPMEDKALAGNMAAASQLKSLQATREVGPYALAGRIRADYDRLKGALQSRGYYAGQAVITITLDGKSLDGKAPDLASFLAAAKPGMKAKIHIGAQPGPCFTVGHITVVPLDDGTQDKKGALSQAEADQEKATSVLHQQPFLTKAERHSMGLESGAPALAADVLAMQARLFTFLQEEGYGLSDVQPPQAIIQPGKQQIDVQMKVHKGPKLVIGPMSFNGLERVRPGYVRRRMMLREGQLYQPSVIEQARLDLGSTGLFSTVQQHNGEKVLPLPAKRSSNMPVRKGDRTSKLPAGAQGVLPLDFDFKEGKRHRLTGDVGYSTDLGGRAGVSWLHRNLLGNGEQLRVTTLATGLGGTAQQGLGYDAYVDFQKPDFLQRSQSLNLRIEGIRQLLYSYGQTAFLLHGGISRPLGKDLSGSFGATLEQEHIRQFGEKDQYFIASLPLQLSYDGTHRDNPIEPATHGVRISLGITPSVSLEHRTSFYVPMNAQISTYLDLTHLGLTKPGDSVLAFRVMAGSVQGASTWALPPDQRLYAGGPGSVRGFRYQGVGPQYGNTKYAIGGTAMDAGTVEFRQRLPKNFGLAAFADAGQVSSNSIPGNGTLRIGYGGGVRYFTPIGPVRVDVALPLNRPYRGDKWELYFGLGETF